MKYREIMNWKKLIAGLGLCLLVLGITGESCTPDRFVDVAVTVDLIAEVHAIGSDNTFSGSKTVSIGDEVDINQIIEDNGLEEIDTLTVQSAFVRTIVKDPAADRQVSGSVTIRQGGGPDASLISYTAADVNSVEYEDWVAVPLQTAGVTVLNSALQNLIDSGTASATFTTSGTSTPIDTPTNFTWEVKLRLNVVGTKKITIFEPI
jgi:hypothetical protein